jgi:hypothetical protein
MEYSSESVSANDTSDAGVPNRSMEARPTLGALVLAKDACLDRWGLIDQRRQEITVNTFEASMAVLQTLTEPEVVSGSSKESRLLPW